MSSQLVARKSIDKLIRESEAPENALKKTLGPWSLTSLGIGAVIGSGIFTVVGTAMAGQKFDAPSIANTPLHGSPEDLEEVQQWIERDGLLFKVRVASSASRERGQSL